MFYCTAMHFRYTRMFIRELDRNHNLLRAVLIWEMQEEALYRGT